MSDPLLRVERLTAGFDRDGRFVPAITDISFQLDAAQTLCLVGESGSGKSTAALSIVNLLPAEGRILSGSIWLGGRDLTGIGDREMQRVRGTDIGFVFQEPMTALNPVFTVGRQIEETLLVHGRADRRNARVQAVELLGSVRIPNPQGRIGAYPHQLSGGLRQRVLIALALACRPRLLIADEPTSALDVTIQAEILDLLRDLQERLGLALLLITSNRLTHTPSSRIPATPTRASCSRRRPVGASGGDDTARGRPVADEGVHEPENPVRAINDGPCGGPRGPSDRRGRDIGAGGGVWQRQDHDRALHPAADRTDVG
jgi:ABC-type glutathione transport system ATPase component